MSAQSSIVTQCLLLAHEAHRNDTRDDGQTPYIVHPLDVLAIADSYGWVTSDEIAGAILIHDVEEDHGDKYPLEAIIARVGIVGTLAHWLCKPPRPEGTDKLQFNAEHYLLLRKLAPVPIRQAKMADRIDNLKAVEMFKPKRRESYMKDTDHLIQALDGTPGLDVLVKYRDQAVARIKDRIAEVKLVEEALRSR